MHSIIATTLDDYRLAFGTGNFRYKAKHFKEKFKNKFSDYILSNEIAFLPEENIEIVISKPNVHFNKSPFSFCSFDVQNDLLRIFYIYSQVDCRRKKYATKVMGAIRDKYKVTDFCAYNYTHSFNEFMKKNVSNDWYLI